MSNGRDKDAENRFWRLHATVGKLVLDGKRVPTEVADIYQRYIIDPPVVEPVEKFALFVDLGIITVPRNYVHASRLRTFQKKNCKKFSLFSYGITDANFPNPSRILQPGDKLHVRAFKQIVGGTTTSEERMAFLVTQKAVYTGAQGASLVFEQKRAQLPKGKWYASLDEKDRLRANADGYLKMSGVRARLDGGFEWDLLFFEDGLRGDDTFLCFTEVEE